MQKYKFTWNRFSEINCEIQNDQITFKRYLYQTFTVFDDSLSKVTAWDIRLVLSSISANRFSKFCRRTIRKSRINYMAKIRSFTSDIDVKIREETYLDWFHDWFASWHLNNNGPPLSSFWSTRPKSTREPSRVPWKIVGRTRPEQSRSDNDGPDYVWIAHVTMNPTACRADACKMRPLPVKSEF